MSTDDFPELAVTLRSDPDAIVDLIRAGLRRGDGPADFDAPPRPPPLPDQFITPWWEASARVHDRHRPTGRNLQNRHDVLVLASDHGIGTVHVHTVPLEASLVQHQLLGLKLL